MAHKIREALNEKEEYKTSRWVTEQEAEVLCGLIKDHNISTVYESGTANGYSACRMSEVGVRVVTFDPCKRAHIWDEVEFKSYRDNIVYIQEDFAIMECHLISESRPRLFFIDGAHTITNCKMDLNTVLRGIKKGDIIALHDYNIRKIAKVIDCMSKTGFRWWVEQTRRGIFVLVKETNAPSEMVVYGS